MESTTTGSSLRERQDWDAVLHRCALSVAADRARTWRSFLTRAEAKLGGRPDTVLRAVGEAYREAVIDGLDEVGQRARVDQKFREHGTTSPEATETMLQMMAKETARQLSSGRMMYALDSTSILFRNRDCITAFDRCRVPGTGKYQVLAGERVAILYILGTSGANIPLHQRVAHGILEDGDSEAVLDTALKLWEPTQPDSTFHLLDKALFAARCV